ncbi:MAG TPA: hypothetical protein VFY39_08000 [Gammaproteobacteria bacterium]|nr:hypothetical protein [Gammaproteobacteria bacterium]
MEQVRQRIAVGDWVPGQEIPCIRALYEPTTGLDPVARHEILAELMEVLNDERRAILFSSQNTQDVEQISDRITFIGRIIDSSDKETFLDRWRRLRLEVPEGVSLPAVPGVVDVASSGPVAVWGSDIVVIIVLEAVLDAAALAAACFGYSRKKEFV